MDRDTDCSEAWLVYGSTQAAPKLLAMLQFLLDDIVARGGSVCSARMGARALRIGHDGLELRLIACDATPPAEALTDATRPQQRDGRTRPDLTRVRLGRLLHTTAHSLHLIVSPQSEAITREDQLAQTRLHLASLIEVARPEVILWQPRGLLLTADEALAADLAVLREPGDPATRFDPSVVRPPPPRRNRADIHPMRPVPRTRGQRADLRSAQRLFGAPDLAHPRPVPRLEPAQTTLNGAMRAAEPPAPARGRSHRLAALTVTLMWTVLLPQLMDLLLPRL